MLNMGTRAKIYVALVFFRFSFCFWGVSCEISDNNYNEPITKEVNGIKSEVHGKEAQSTVKPFGSGKRQREIETLKGFPKPSEFINEFVTPSSPAVFKEAAKKFPAHKRWQRDSYFLQKPQSATFWLEMDMESGLKDLTTFKKFLQTYRQNELKLIDVLPSYLHKDVLLPSCLLCGPILKQLSQHAFIMTNDEDRSPVLLRQEEDTITCLISGDRSEFTLVSSPRFKDKFPADLRKLDVEQVDLTQYPGLADVEYHKANLTAGDCVYIPAKWYYQVNSFSRTTEVEVTWRRQQKSTLMTEKSCKSTISGPPTLDKFHFNNLSRHENHMEHRILHNFIGYLRHDVKLTLKEFIEKMKKDKMLKNMTDWNDEYEDVANEVFGVLNLNTDEVFSLADIDALTPLRLEQMTGLLEDRMADLEEIMQDQNVASSAKSIGGKLFDQGALAKQEALLKKMIREATSKIQEFKKTAQAIEKSIHQSEEEIRQKEKEASAAVHKDRSTNKSNKFGEKATKPGHKKKVHEVADQTMDDSIKEAIEDEEEIIAEPDTIEPTTKAAETPAESGSLNQNQSSVISEQKNVKKKNIHSGSDRNVKDEL